METIGAYLERKHRELRLIGACLASHVPPPPRSVDEAIERKFRLAAALKAEHMAAQWSLTETRWAETDARLGPYRMSWGYQRADLAIRGPAPYPALSDGSAETLYTTSGMAAISAFVMALGRVADGADVMVPPGCYRETLEVVEAYGRDVRIRRIGTGSPRRGGVKVLLIDSYVERGLGPPGAGLVPAPDLVLFDTTCLASTSGRIRRVLDWAAMCGLPLVLVRSHTKLDSLGVEYGRLGSAVLVAPGAARPGLLCRLGEEMRNAVRLFGSAAIPAHLPPFAGSEAHAKLSAARVAGILRNTRFLARRLARACPTGLVKTFAHGLYLTLGPTLPWEPEEAQAAAASLVGHIRARSLPVRHAGSFGFDFVAAEHFTDARTERNLVRLSLADLPAPVMERIADEIPAWWAAFDRTAPARDRRSAA